MAAKRRRTSSNFYDKKFWTIVLVGSLLATLCILITISSSMSKPFMPTWDDIFEAFGLTESAAPQPMESELQVHVIDVGNADSILVMTQGKTLLIDAGEKSAGDTVVEYLKKHSVKRLDYVIATHADGDHIGGMKQVVESVEVGHYIMAFMPDGFTPTTKTYRNLLEALDKKGIKITEAKPGLSFALGEATLDILGPVQDFEENNNQSVVCKVTFGAKKFLFMGDAEEEAEEALLLANTDLSADFLKVGHHGSNSSSTKKFLIAVKPTYAAITCGEDNSYNHPHSNVLTRLRDVGATYYRSDIHGTIVATTDGATISITTEK